MNQRQALRVMLEGDSVFLTGPPGAGKTYVLNEYIRLAQKAGKRLAITASTGIAATHINGTTIHSWSGLGIRDRLSQHDLEWLSNNDHLIKRYNGTDVLIIDEVSMLHGQRLDMVNQACKLLRNSQKPFGGLQVILVGDLFQLPPVSPGKEMFDFVHLSHAWEELNPRICYLTEQHRQEGDNALLRILEAMRDAALDVEHQELLQARMNQPLPSDIAVTRLYTHNIDVESINQKQLQALPGQVKTFTMYTKGAAAKVDQLKRSLLAPEKLDLKVGAEVMFVSNNFAEGYVNGSRGQVVEFRDGMPAVKLLDGDRLIKVDQQTWTLTEDDKKKAEIAQLPLRLAWAITIHKSQGMSLDAAQIDLSRSFTPGMGYVALSRVRSLEGIYLMGLNRTALQLNPLIYELDRELRRLSAMLAETTKDYEEQAEEPNAPMAGFDDDLFAKLRAWRLEKARAERIAPFMIAHDTTLTELATHKPKDLQALRGIKGFGPKKIDNYGTDVIDIVADHI